MMNTAARFVPTLTGLMVVALVSTSATPASAQAREDGAPAEAMGVGDNVRASTWGPGALFFNPAGMSRARAYIFQAGYSYLDGRDGHAFTAAAVDSKTNPLVALGTAYTYITGQAAGLDRDGHQFRAGLSTGYASGDVGIYAGVGVRYLDLTVGAGDSEANGQRDDVDDWTLDAGLIFDIANRIKFGVTGANLIDTGSAEAARKLGLGAAFTFDALEVSGDVELDLADQIDSTVLRYGFGAQYNVGGLVNLSMGLTVDRQLDQERLSGGIGYAESAWGIALAYSSAVNDEKDMVFGVSIRYLPPYQP